MKKTMLVLAMCLTAISLIAVTNTWEGDYNYYWNNANNWSQGHIPLSSEDVVVPSSVSYTYYPSINNYDAVCRTVTVQSNGQLRISSNASLTVTYDMTIHGKLDMVNSGCVLNVNDDIFWKSGSTDNINNGIMYINDDWTFENGTHCTLGTGNTVNFNGSSAQNIYCYDSNATFGNLEIDKPGTGNYTYIQGASNQPMRVAGDMTVFTGNEFNLQGEDLIVTGTLDIENGAEMKIMGSIGELELNSDFNLYGHLNIGTGSVLAHGEFELETTGELTISGGNFICDAAYTGNWQYIRGTFNMSSGLFEMTYNPVRILSTCTDIISGGTFRVGYYFSATYAGTFQPTGGEVEVTDDYASGIIYCSNGNYFYDLRISGNTYTNTDLTINHNLNIDSGYFKLNGYTVDVDDYVYIYDTLQMTNSADELNCSERIYWKPGSNDNITAGNIYTTYWTFEDGTNAQIGTGHITHISSGIGLDDADAEFGNIEAGPFSRLESDGDRDPQPLRAAGDYTLKSGANWQTSVDMIVNGILDIEDGASLSIYNSSTITTNSDFTLNGELDLGNYGNTLIHGEFDLASTGILTIDGGSFTYDEGVTYNVIYGTLNISDGLYSANEQILIQSSATTNITGGVIRSRIGLNASYTNTFQPSGGSFEVFENTANGHIICSNGNYFHDFKVNCSWELAGATFQSDILIQNDLEITDGRLYINEYEIDVLGDMRIYDRLIMDNSSGIINLGNDITWYSGSSNLGSTGTINVSGDWIFENGTDAQLGTGNSVYFKGSGNSTIRCDDPDAEFGNIIIDQPAGRAATYIHASSTETMRVAGDMTVNAGNVFHVWHQDLIVDGYLDIENTALLDLMSAGSLTNNSDFGLNGHLDIDLGETLIHGTFDLASTGIMTIDGGSFTYDEGIGDNDIYGTLNISDGLYSANEVIKIQSSANTNITGGIIRSAFGLYAQYINTFQPSGGVSEVSHDADSPRLTVCSNGNYFHDLKINTSDGGTSLGSDITIQNDLNITDGELHILGYEVTVNNDAHVYGFIQGNSSSDVLNIGNDIIWYSGSDAAYSLGSFNIYGDWNVLEGAIPWLGINSTVNFVGSENSNIYCNEYNARFGNIVVEKDSELDYVYIDAGNYVRAGGSIDINVGNLYLQESHLDFGSDMNISNGSSFQSRGTPSLDAVVARHTYPFVTIDVESGGNIGAEYTIFEFLSGDGLHVQDGATIDPAYPLDNCIFRYGETDGTLLTIDNDQTLTIDGTEFYADMREATFNVTKNVDAGEITFTNSSGSFNGPDYENDPYNRLHWSGFSAPTVTTDTITNIDETTATGGGNVTADGGSFVTEKGVCWSITTNPTIVDSHTVDGSGTGTFVSSLTSLDPDTHYYVRSYATNAVGTSYGNEVEFTTLSTTPPDPPANLTIEIVGTDVVLNWDAVTGADSYKIYSSNNPYESYENWNYEDEVTATTWSEVIPSEKKFYYVSAVN